MFGKGDPYVEMNLVKQMGRSATANSNHDPEMNFEATFNDSGKISQSINPVIFHTVIGKDDFLGNVIIDLEKV